MNPYFNLAAEIAGALQAARNPSFGANNGAAAGGQQIGLQSHMNPGFSRAIHNDFCKQLFERKIHTVDEIRDYLDRGADLNRPMTIGEFRAYTPLHYAAISGNGYAIEAMIASGQLDNINTTDGNDFSALDLICGADLSRIRKSFRPDQSKEGRNARRKGVEALLNNFADMRRVDSQGRTILHYAAENNFADLIEILVRNPPGMQRRTIDVNVRDKHKETPLHAAARRSQLYAAEKLLEQDADVNAANNNGETPLHQVCISGWDQPATGKPFYSGETACLLMAHGADYKVIDKRSKNKPAGTPFEHAARQAKGNLITYVLKKQGAEFCTKESRLGLLKVADTNVGMAKKSQIDREKFDQFVKQINTFPCPEPTGLKRLCEIKILNSIRNAHPDASKDKAIEQLPIPKGYQQDLMNQDPRDLDLLAYLK